MNNEDLANHIKMRDDNNCMCISKWLRSCVQNKKGSKTHVPNGRLSVSTTNTNSDDNLSLYVLAQASMSNDRSIYHNHRHLQDVVLFIREAIDEAGKTNPAFREREWRDVLIAAAYMHDVAHPAGEDRENTIEAVTRHVTGKLPSIDATLEQLHGEIGVALMRKTTSFLKVALVDRDVRIERITKLILSTNIQTYGVQPIESMDTMAVATVLLRCADLSHFTFDLPKHLRRVDALNREIGSTISREKNAEFVTQFVLPQFEALSRICGTPRAEEWLTNVRFKLRYWTELACEDSLTRSTTTPSI